MFMWVDGWMDLFSLLKVFISLACVYIVFILSSAREKIFLIISFEIVINHRIMCDVPDSLDKIHSLLWFTIICPILQNITTFLKENSQRKNCYKIKSHWNKKFFIL